MDIKHSNQQNPLKLGLRLRRLREERKLTAAEMAQALGVAPTTYREWERGRGLIAPPFLKMSEVLAISVTELLSGQKATLDGPIERLREIEQMLREVRVKLGLIT